MGILNAMQSNSSGDEEIAKIMKKGKTVGDGMNLKFAKELGRPKKPDSAQNMPSFPFTHLDAEMKREFLEDQDLESQPVKVKLKENVLPVKERQNNFKFFNE